MQTIQAPFREPTQHGSRDFPLAVYRSHPNHHADILFSHWHDETELMILTAGEATFQLDGVPCSIKRGDMLVVNSGVIHAGTSTAFRTCAFVAVVFDPAMFSGLMNANERRMYLEPFLARQTALPVRLDTDDSTVPSLISCLVGAADNWLSDRPGSRTTMSAALLALLAAAARNAWFLPREGEGPGSGASKRARIRQAMQYIRTSCGQALDIDRMAAHVHLSRFHFCRQFREVTGMTPLAYLMHCRMQTAEALLRDPDRRIMDVALDAGFGNTSWFITCFRRMHGCTPAAYRKGLTERPRQD